MIITAMVEVGWIAMYKNSSDGDEKFFWKSKRKKGAKPKWPNPLFFLVGAKGFEPLTPTVSGLCLFNYRYYYNRL
jgi:hypothetical protein